MLEAGVASTLFIVTQVLSLTDMYKIKRRVEFPHIINPLL